MPFLYTLLGTVQGRIAYKNISAWNLLGVNLIRIKKQNILLNLLIVYFSENDNVGL